MLEYILSHCYVVEPDSGNANEDNNMWMLLKQLMLSCLAWTFNSIIDASECRAAIKAALSERVGCRTKQDAYDAQFLPLRTFGRNLDVSAFMSHYQPNMPLMGDTQRSNSMSPLSSKADVSGMHRTSV
jgi:hypothetical protein